MSGSATADEAVNMSEKPALSLLPDPSDSIDLDCSTGLGGSRPGGGAGLAGGGAGLAGGGPGLGGGGPGLAGGAAGLSGRDEGLSGFSEGGAGLGGGGPGLGGGGFIGGKSRSSLLIDGIVISRNAK